MKIKKYTFLMVAFTPLNLYADNDLPQKEETSVVLIIAIILALIFLASTLFLIKELKISKTNNQISSESTFSTNIVDNSILNGWIKRNEKLEKELIDKNEEIKRLNSQINELKTPIIKDEEPLNSNEIKVDNSENETKEEEKIIDKEKIFFFFFFDSDGYFSSNDLKDYSDNNEFYKIIISQDHAEFESYNNKYSLDTGLEYINDYIKPFCFEMNFRGDNVTKIATLKRGVVIKEGSRWKVQQKAEISYE